MRILLHVGVYKTGSTLVQKHIVWEGQKQLNDAGFVYTTELGRFLERRVVKNGEIGPFNKFLSKWKGNNAGKDAMISIEGLFAESMYSLAGGERNADLIQKAMDGNEVKVVAFVRRQDTYIESTYSQWVKSIKPIEFAQYKKQFDIYKLHWPKYLKPFLDRFDIYVFPYEDLLTNPQRYVDNLFSPFDIKVKIKTPFPVKNPSINKKQIEGLVKSGKCDRVTRHRLEKSHPKDPKINAGWFSSLERKGLLQYYEDSNDELFNKIIKGYKNIYSV